jgi:heavy metal sensor kinase
MSSAPPENIAADVFPTSRRRSWWFARRLRTRLAAWNTLIIILFTVALLIGLRQGSYYLLLQEEDRLLDEDAIEVGLLVDLYDQLPDPQLRALNRKATSHAPRKWFARVLDANGNPTPYRTRIVPDLNFPTERVSSNIAITLGTYRLVERWHTTETGKPFLIQVGATTEAIREDVNRLTELLLVAGGTLLIVAPLGGYWLAGRAIRPLARIIQTTANLRPRKLEERLPIRGTDDELDQLSNTINGFLNRIADYLAHHHHLLANVAHELRSPLAAIRSSTEVALKQDRSPDEYRELLESIVDECGRLGNLVQQLLLLAEVDAGRLERSNEPIRLDNIVRKAIDMFQGVAETQGVELKATKLEETWICGDAGHLRQVVLNLIDNALKFSKDGGNVSISVTADSTLQQAQLTVSDTGTGIDPKHLPYIFERFYRVERGAENSKRSGSGLGLSICKALVAAHGGSIRVESIPGDGTSVFVSLPLGRPNI